jgi:spermidine/putrescine transport system substrate-binding protein
MALPIPIALAFLLVFTSCTRTETPAVKELRLYTWSQYFDDKTIHDFEKEEGVKVKVDYFSSNEQMLTKLQLTQGERGYDLILPSDYMVRLMIEMKLLKPLDKSKLPFLKDFEKEALNPPYDPGLQYSVPLAVGLTGLAWNTKLMPKLPGSFGWKNLFEDAAYKGKITLLDDIKEVLQAALLANGKDLASANEQDIKDAFAYLRKHKSQLKGFTTETRPVIEADECALCMTYSGDARQVAEAKPEIRFVVPNDGASIWTDNFAIPANAAEPELAHKFIAKMLQPAVAKEFTLRTGYRTFSKAAKAMLPKEITSNPVIYPQAQGVKFHYLVDKKELAGLIDKEWALLKSE